MGENLWEGASDENEAKLSYVMEMVKAPASWGGLLGAVAAGAILSIPLGLGAGLIPLVAFGTAEAIAALFIPSSPVFRAKVNARKRQERRERVRDHLTAEISGLVPPDDAHWGAYHRMRERLDSLKQIAQNRDTSLSDTMVAQLDDATVDYLSLWVAWLAMADRWQNSDEAGLRSRIDAIDAQLERTDAALEQKRLLKARKDLERILHRREGLWGQATSVEAAMLSMADTFEEVYQRVVTNPNSGDIATELNQAVERMRVEEELDFAVEEELGGVIKKKKGARAARAKRL